MKIALLIFSILFLSSFQASSQSLPVNYAQLKKEIIAKRDSLQYRYTRSDSTTKNIIVKYSTNYVFGIITNDIFNYWYGTPWDFNGQTCIPGQGKIACGYFVTAVLGDAGFDIPRVGWAQLASETAIKKMTSDIKRFSNSPIEEVKAYVKKRGDGLYIVGLDTHVGFISVKGDTIKFIHSNYFQPDLGVMSEDFETDNPLKASKYRVVGKLLSDDMILNWINKKKYE